MSKALITNRIRIYEIYYGSDRFRICNPAPYKCKILRKIVEITDTSHDCGTTCKKTISSHDNFFEYFAKKVIFS